MTFKRQSYFFSKADEDMYSSLLLESFPEIKFRDGQCWGIDDEIPYKDNIAKCESGLAYIWNPEIHPVVPMNVRDGKMWGACTRQVIQFMRCYSKNSEIRWNQMAASFESDNKIEKSYVNKVFRLQKK